MGLHLLDTSHRWNHTVCGLCVWPRSRSTVFSGFVRGVAGVIISFHFMDVAHFVYLFTHQLMDIGIAFAFWLIRITLRWIFMSKFPCGHMFSVLLGVYPGVACWVVQQLCLAFWGPARPVFPSGGSLPARAAHPDQRLLPLSFFFDFGEILYYFKDVEFSLLSQPRKLW